MIRRTNIPSRTSGIYFIESALTGRLYVGSSIDLRCRKNGHFNELDKGIHCNSYLQRHANKYGVGDLKFSVVKFCPPEALIEREQYYMDATRPVFNLCPTANSTLGTHHTNPTKKKISEAATGRTHSDITKKKMSEQIKAWYQTEAGLKYRKQISQNPKRLAQLAQMVKGRKCTDTTKKKISEATTGKKHTTATKKKMAERGKAYCSTEEGRKHHERLAQMAKGRKRTNITKRRISEGRKAWYQTEEGVKWNDSRGHSYIERQMVD